MRRASSPKGLRGLLVCASGQSLGPRRDGWVSDSHPIDSNTQHARCEREGLIQRNCKSQEARSNDAGHCGLSPKESNYLTHEHDVEEVKDWGP